MRSLIEDKAEFKVLVVDDSAITREYLLELLRSNGYTSVQEAESGVTAKQLLESEDYDLLLLDINMPGVDGMQVLQFGKALQPNCQFIIITAYGTLTTAIEALDLGAFSYITKPFEDLDFILGRIESALERVSIIKYNIDMINRLQLAVHKLKRTQKEKKTDKRIQQTEEVVGRLTAIIDELQEFRKGTRDRGKPKIDQ